MSFINCIKVKDLEKILERFAHTIQWLNKSENNFTVCDICQNYEGHLIIWYITTHEKRWTLKKYSGTEETPLGCVEEPILFVWSDPLKY